MTTGIFRLRATRPAVLTTASCCTVMLAVGCALHQARPLALLRPGTYRVTFRSEGSGGPGVLQGRLWLAAVPAGARSDGAPLYGSMTVDPTACEYLCGSDCPRPSSRDPKKPGVLVVRDDQYGIELLVSSCNNQDGQSCFDGCGVRLMPGRSSTGTWISGTWVNEGLIPGFGMFDAVWLR